MLQFKDWFESIHLPGQKALVDALKDLKTQLQHTDHVEAVTKCNDLINKGKENEFIIAFCGHFSAGKSTMINTLMGEQLLPTNPIPTSANVVKIKAGEPYAIVGFKDKGPQAFPYPYDMEEIHSYCTDGDKIDFVEISHETTQLPKEVAIFDTPGIDSSEDAHRVSAESRLHLADVIIYMMDYNHVQSKVNIEFLQQLERQHKNYIIIINQIDKHKSFELSFSTYKKQIEESFLQQGILEDRLFFSTMKAPHHPNNELSEIKAYLAETLTNRNRLVIETILKECWNLIQKNHDWLNKKNKEEIKMLRSTLGGKKNIALLQAECNELLEEKDRVADLPTQFENEFMIKLDLLLENANLMPYHTRVHGQEFLESRQISFRVGHLFSKKRTSKEKETRYKLFYDAVQSNTETYITIHLKKLMADHFKAYHIYDEDIRRKIHELTVPLKEAVFIKAINKGALISRESVMNYCSNLSREIRALYKKEAIAYIAQGKEILQNKLMHLEEQTEQRVRKQQRLIAAAKRLQAMEEGMRSSLLNNLEKITFTGEKQELHSDKVEEYIDVFHQDKESFNETDNVQKTHIGKVSNTIVRQEKLYENTPNQKEVIENLTTAARYLQEIPGFSQRAKDIEMRAQTIRNRKFTVALFGAFSAGKSSFANALLGERILPVSPHPTTATINKVLPPDEGHPHQTVIVQFKKESQLIDDINEMIKISGKSISSLNELSTLLQTHDKTKAEFEKSEKESRNEGEEESKGKEIKRPLLEFVTPTKMTFLRSVVLGLQEMYNKLGQSEQVAIDTFQAYIATEQYAGFIELISLYYDCPLTQKGIILVDTPGADSIHARHTEVAFNYVTQADVVLFVSYYNHAFSRADREFLIQLGRVKEHFTRDKMFFLINAADLSESKEDLQHVIAHVEKNLLTCEIRNAKIYPISSYLSLLAEQYEKNHLQEEQIEEYKSLTGTLTPLSKDEGLYFAGMSNFKADFYQFMLQDIMSMVISSSMNELHKSVDQLGEWIQIQKKNDVEKEKRIEELKKEFTKADEIIAHHKTDIERDLLDQEIDELIYYVKQRVFFRYRDEFKVIFSPPSFKEDEDLLTTLLRCTNEVIRFVAIDLAQDMRVTAFRLEKYLQYVMREMYLQIEEKIQQVTPDFTLGSFEFQQLKRPIFTENLYEVNPLDFKENFKKYNSRAEFFAEKGSQNLRDELGLSLRKPVQSYSDNATTTLKEVYINGFDQYVQDMSKDIKEQVGHFYQGQIEFLENQAKVQEMENRYTSLLKLV